MQINRDLATEEAQGSPSCRIPIAAPLPVELGAAVAGTVAGGDAIAAGVWGHGVRILLGSKH